MSSLAKSEEPNDAEKKEELERDPETNAKEENLKEEEEEVSDSESTSTILYTRSEQIERLKDLEQENEVKDGIGIVTIDDELMNTTGANTPETDTENDDPTEVVMVKDNTEGRTEIDNLEEVIEQEAVIEDSNKSQRGRTLTRSSRRLRQSQSTGRQKSPLKIRISSGQAARQQRHQR